jgi:hypothetical protein
MQSWNVQYFAQPLLPEAVHKVPRGQNFAVNRFTAEDAKRRFAKVLC